MVQSLRHPWDLQPASAGYCRDGVQLTAMPQPGQELVFVQRPASFSKAICLQGGPERGPLRFQYHSKSCSKLGEGPREVPLRIGGLQS